MFRKIVFIGGLLLFTLGVSCQTAVPEPIELPVTVEVTRVVEVPVEQPAPEAPSFNPMFPVEFSTLKSAVTNREYAITVILPMTYTTSEASYPVIYVTDGDFYAIPLGMAAGQLAFGQEIPEFIVVGVDYGSPNVMEWVELRDKDMGAGGRQRFLQFFAEELIPHIEATYRTAPTNRTLAGHSSGGDFALYTWINGTGTFSNFIASSPGHVGSFSDSLGELAANRGEGTTRLYVSVGELDAATTVAGEETFAAALAEMDMEGLAYKTAVLDGETHFSARPRAFMNGLRWLFANE
ncbi:MAG: alpha/beta hydrolase [Ardenticatenaceae bacterium]|nr:alpha/beta hydrolase [Ardenticatenaceae bacterium]